MNNKQNSLSEITKEFCQLFKSANYEYLSINENSDATKTLYFVIKMLQKLSELNELVLPEISIMANDPIVSQQFPKYFLDDVQMGISKFGTFKVSVKKKVIHITGSHFSA